MNKFVFRSVGQGLFYTGTLMHQTYNFVYDCGTSNKQYYVKKEIDSYIRSLQVKKDDQPIIDFIVISHLHNDHFSGLFYLLQNVQVKKIYLPYLGRDSNIIRTALALAVYGDFEEFDNIEELENTEREKERTFHFMCGLYGVEDSYGYLEYRQYRERVVFIKTESEKNANDLNDYVCMTETFRVDLGGNPYWQFTLFQSGVGLKKLDELNVALKGFGDLSANNLSKEISKNKYFLLKLKRAYESVFGQGNALNLTSILLLHFPLYNHAETLYLNKKRYEDLWEYWSFRFYPCYTIGEMFNRLSCTATLLIGDAMIDKMITNAILRVLNKKELFLLQVPHHGAMENWQVIDDTKILADVYVIPFGYGNRHKHPSTTTIDDLTKKKREFYCVTQAERFKYFIN